MIGEINMEDCMHCGGELDTAWFRQTADDDGIEYKLVPSCDWNEIEWGEDLEHRIDR